MPMQVAAEDGGRRSAEVARRAPRGVAGAPRRGAREGGQGAAPPNRRRAAAGRARRARSRHRPRPRDGRRPRLRREPFQPRRAGAAPAGSAFKPFVYAAALEAGYSPATVIDHLDDPIATLQGAWTPEDEHSPAPSMTPAHGAPHVEQPRGGAAAAAGRHRRARCSTRRTMGVGDVPSVPSLALGSGEVTLQSMTAAYAAFANHGLVPQPDADPPRRGPRRPRAVSNRSDSSSRAISDTTAFLMSTMLADVINAGTGAARAQPRLHAAGRRQDRHDQRLQRRVVRRLHAEARRPASGSASISRRRFCPNGFAADVAVPLWAKFMKAATRRRQARLVRRRPPASPRASVCRLSGKLATDGCQDVEVVDKDGELERRSMVYTEYFARGTEPTGLLRSASDARHPDARSPASSARRASTPAPPHVDDPARQRPPPPPADDAGTAAAAVETPADAPGEEARLLVADLRRRHSNDARTSPDEPAVRRRRRAAASA